MVGTISFEDRVYKLILENNKEFNISTNYNIPTEVLSKLEDDFPINEDNYELNERRKLKWIKIHNVEYYYSAVNNQNNNRNNQNNNRNNQNNNRNNQNNNRNNQNNNRNNQNNNRNNQNNNRNNQNNNRNNQNNNRNNQNNNRNNQNNNQNNNPKEAKAPYNFIELNKIVVPSDNANTDFTSFTGNSGYIDIDIRNLTHLFTRGEGANFFKIGTNGKIAIPGTTLRGMLRTLVEIMSFGKFTTYDDKRLYLRSFADSSNSSLKKYHLEKLGKISENDSIGENIKVGFLKYDKQVKTYKIYEAKDIILQREINSSDSFKYIIDKENNEIKIITGIMPGMNKKHWKLKYELNKDKFYLIPQDVLKDYKEDKTRNTQNDMKDLLHTARNKSQIYSEGVPVFYTTIQDNKNNEVVNNFGHTKFYRLPYEKKIGDNAHIPPLLKDDNITDIAEAVFGKAHKVQDKSIAGKVFVEDFILQSEDAKFTEAITHILSSPKPTSVQLYLVQPKGKKTTIDKLNHWASIPCSPIRGYKAYWHKNNNYTTIKNLNWQKTSFSKIEFKNIFSLRNNQLDIFIEDNKEYFEIIHKPDNNIKSIDFKTNVTFETLPDKLKKTIRNSFNHNSDKIQTKLIKALKPNATFKGRIRFDNLSDVELGALLFALDLPEGCKHKIGMAKPLGLGSVSITPSLKFINRETRYSSVFNDDGTWNLGFETENNKDFKKIFAKYVLEKINDTQAKDLWETERMKQLKVLLTYNETEMKETAWLQKTSYMDLTEFKHKKVLDYPENILKLSNQ